jgi:hypothetical protein
MLLRQFIRYFESPLRLRTSSPVCATTTFKIRRSVTGCTSQAIIYASMRTGCLGVGEGVRVLFQERLVSISSTAN